MEGKQIIANAIINNGGTASANSTFTELASQISSVIKEEQQNSNYYIYKFGSDSTTSELGGSWDSTYTGPVASPPPSINNYCFYAEAKYTSSGTNTLTITNSKLISKNFKKLVFEGAVDYKGSIPRTATLYLINSEGTTLLSYELYSTASSEAEKLKWLYSEIPLNMPEDFKIRLYLKLTDGGVHKLHIMNLYLKK